MLDMMAFEDNLSQSDTQLKQSRSLDSALERNTVASGYISLPTPVASDSKGAASKRYYGSDSYRSKLCEFFRDGETDPAYPNPELLEALLGYPTGWTE